MGQNRNPARATAGLFVVALSLCGCDEWLATRRDNSPTPRLAMAESLERPARPERPERPHIPAPVHAERPAPTSATPTPTPPASVGQPVMPPTVKLAPVPEATIRPTPAPLKAAVEAAQAAGPGAAPTPHTFPAAPRFPAAPQPGSPDAPKFQPGGFPGGFGQRSPPGPRPMMPRMPNMQIARPPPQQ